MEIHTSKDNVPANQHQVGGDHYKSNVQHWDYVAANNLDYFQGQISKYVERWKKKNGLQDLKKARHFLDKYIELETTRAENGTPINLNDMPKRDLRPSSSDPDPVSNEMLRAITDNISLATKAPFTERDAPDYSRADEIPVPAATFGQPRRRT